MLGTSAGAAALAAFVSMPFSAAASAPSPLVVPPSEKWEGVDGSWSTFSIHVGTPEQVLSVLVSTSFPNAALVLNSSCSDGPTSDCASARGGVFSPNSSSTWQDHGIFDLFPELNYTTSQDRGEYGLDTIGLGLGDAGPDLDGQVVASLETTDYYIGMLGIDPQPTNWTLNFTEQTPSLFKTLYNQSLIPSLSYSYTAGAKYQNKGVLGSLVFGGYDGSRVQTNNMSFTMAPDVTADLVLAIQSIQSSSSSSGQPSDLLRDPVFAKIDSTVPYLILPPDTCQSFEDQFGLVWDPNAGYDGLYTLSDAQHDSLTSSNPTFTFNLGNSLSGDNIELTLPYSAFDLTGTSPFVNETTYYFPLLPAANDSQITLGRAFLQESMLIADYEHELFSIYQCVWNSDAQQDLQLINLSTSSGPANTTDPNSAPPSSNQSVIIGVGVGVGAGVPLILAILLFVARRKRVWPFHKTPPPVPPKTPTNTELDSRLLSPGGTTICRASTITKREPSYIYEADNKPDPSLAGYYNRPELDASPTPNKFPNEVELPTSAVSGHLPDRPRQRSELPGLGIAPYGYAGPERSEEVEGSGVVTELPGSMVSSAYLSPRAGRTGGRGRGSGSGPSSNEISRRSSSTMGLLGYSQYYNRGTVSPAHASPSSRGGSGAGTRRSSSVGLGSPMSGVSSASLASEQENTLRQMVSAVTETDPGRLFATPRR